MAEVQVPVSIGELVDKITILRIKSQKIGDPAKLVNVRAELKALEAVCLAHRIDLGAPEAAELTAVNGRLWDIEDQIRDKEKAKDFGAAFVELARSVYLANDQRFAAKSRLNQKYGSAIREEKSYKEYT